ncbi:MAG: DNA-directed RNA polymerase subunit B [Candidatus Aenigmatarchaeota archaeon]
MNDIFLNGALIGETEDAEGFVEEFRRKRRGGIIPDPVNVYYNEKEKEIYVNSDNGRTRRPLIVVENGEPRIKDEHIEKIKNDEMSWNDLVDSGIIEWLDAEEEENAFVALKEEDLTEDHTHLEINPLLILGISASMIPFAEFNRGDRVNFGAKMTGQALGLYSMNYPVRTDTKSNILIYPQPPLVTTDTYSMMGFDKHPAGQNVVVALLSYKGYNMEDSVVVNKNSIERGMGRSYFYRTYSSEEMRYWGGQEDEIKIPEKDVRGYRSEEAYSHLSEEGVSSPEQEVESGDVLVGKVSPLRFMEREEFSVGMQNKREASLTVRHGESGIVDKVLMTESSDGNKLLKVTLREPRTPEIGDKFASRHGQKGVIGLIEREENLPFTENGITPDIIMNPHSIPSRLTAGQLLEMISGKIGALKGEKMNETPFNADSEEKLKKELKELGFRSDGKEVLYNGETGEMLEAEIFTGMIYYQKLEHMVSNKLHARSRGPVALLTKQPTEGRAKEGGLKLGEMEKDCILSHGASLLLKERFSSDEVELPVCKNCGLLAVKDHTKDELYCPVCGDSDIEHVKMSYAFKLLLDELKSMMIYPKLNVEEE